jgi:hypothetical protein
MSDFINVDINNDGLFEAILRQAVIKNHENEIAAIPTDEELRKLYTFSDEHNRKMKKMFSADRRQEAFVVIFKWTKVAAITICISASVLFSALLTSAEFRKAVGDVIVTRFERFTKFESLEANDNFIERDWSPEYIPTGFVLHDNYEVGEIKGIEFINADNIMIDFMYMPSGFSTSVDNEHLGYSIIVENGIIYHLFEATSENERYENMIVWDMNGYRFMITSNYNVDELMKIAFSVK